MSIFSGLGLTSKDPRVTSTVFSGIRQVKYNRFLSWLHGFMANQKEYRKLQIPSGVVLVAFPIKELRLSLKKS